MSEKTEEPTRQRIRKARRDGQVAHSKDFTQTVLVVAMFGYLLGCAEAIVRDFGEMILMPVEVMGMDFDAAVNALATSLLRRGLAMLAPFLGIVIGLGLLVEWTQTGMNISFKALVPSGKKLDVVANVKNLFSAKNLFEFLKSNLKVLLLSAVVYGVLRSALGTLITLPHGGLTAVAVGTAVLLKTMMVHVSIGYTLVAVADLFWQRRQYLKQLRMTKDEVKREWKEAEGDPHIKHKRRELHQELLEQRQDEQVRRSSVVVTNPTHLAVALSYVKDLTPLPLVMAMGEGPRAERIKAVALRHGVPVLENVPLARALMASARLDDYIPADLIEPVAEVLRQVQMLKEGEA